jgi:hypothetical protein
MDSEDIKDDPLEQALDDILGNDNYRLKYNYDNFPNTSLYCYEVDKIEAVINKFPAPLEGASKNNNTEDGFLDLKKALRSFRSRKNRNTTMSSRSPSPVFLSQNQLTQERETSTPVLAYKGIYYICISWGFILFPRLPEKSKMLTETVFSCLMLFP